MSEATSPLQPTFVYRWRGLDEVSAVDYEMEDTEALKAAVAPFEGYRRFRAIRPDGNLLYEAVAPSKALGLTILSRLVGDGLHVYGDYEWQQQIGEQWVTLRRYFQPPRCDR